MADNLNLQVVIRTEADVAAVEKTTGEIGKLTKGTDDLDSTLARLKNTLAQAEEKQVASAAAAGEHAVAMGDMEAVAGAAGGALAAVGAVLTSWIGEHKEIAKSWENLKSAVTGTLSDIGEAVLGDGSSVTKWLDGLTTALGGQTEAMKKWGEHSKTAAQDQADFMKASAEATNEALKSESEAFQNASEAIKDHTKFLELELDAQAKLVQMRADEAKAEVDADVNLSPEEKRLKKKAIDEQSAGEVGQLADAKSNLRIGTAQSQTDLATSELEKKNAEVAEQEKKVAALKELEARAALEKGAREQAAQLKNAMQLDPSAENKAALEGAQRAAVLAGGQTLEAREKARALGATGTVESEKEKLETLEESRQKAADKLRAAVANQRRVEVTETQGQATRAAQAESRMRISDTNERGRADKAEQDNLGKEAADAAKEAKKATSEGDKGTKEISAILKQLAQMIGGRDKAMTAELQNMARSLADGASGAELAKIKQAADVLSKSQNEQAASMAAMVQSLVGAVQSSAALAKDAMDKARSLEAQIQNMR